VAVYVEDWAAVYGSPYLVAAEDVALGPTPLLEDGPDELHFHTPETSLEPIAVAFVDGVRRGEATLYLTDAGVLARGIAGAHGCGAVIAEWGLRARFERCATTRLVIWGSGVTADLPSASGGYEWTSHSIASVDPDAPLQDLQRRMREAEGRLAEELCADGYLTIVDGPLNFVRSRDLPVVGFVKTHHQPLLVPEFHVRVPELAAGQRTSVFAKRADIYSAYVRLAPRARTAGPWSGIVRIEVPSSAGLKQAAATADLVAAMLPRFAGVAHADPRAPQNLQPVAALERHLRHLLGDAGLATRAVRDAVARLHLPAGVGESR
jgi:hypothetical protein